jgi:predicted PurR-regulated permease PerM
MRNMRLWAILAGLAVFFLLLYMLRSVLTPFVAGLAIAYFLDPLADRWSGPAVRARWRSPSSSLPSSWR